MIKNSTAKTTKLRRGTQDLLERRGMAASTARRSPELHLAGVLARQSATGAAEPPARGGRHLDTTATPGAAPNLHAELHGHRHRGAEKHSAH